MGGTEYWDLPAMRGAANCTMIVILFCLLERLSNGSSTICSTSLMSLALLLEEEDTHESQLWDYGPSY